MTLRTAKRYRVTAGDAESADSVGEPFVATLPPFIFSGVLLGLLPMCNSAVFLAAAAVLGLLFILFPLRLQMLALAVTAGCDRVAPDALSEHWKR